MKNWTKIWGDGVKAQWEVKYPSHTTMIDVNEDAIEINGAGNHFTFLAGTFKYDSQLAQLNAIEDGIYKTARWWDGAVVRYVYWQMTGSDPNKIRTKENNVRGRGTIRKDEWDLVDKYSPKTCQGF